MADKRKARKGGPTPNLPDPRVRGSAPKPSTRDPRLIGSSESLEVFRQRLARLGIEPDETVEVGPSHDETPEQAALRVRRAAEAKSARWLARVPDEFADAALDDLDPEVRQTVDRWLEDTRTRNLVLAGNVGAGKTHTGYAIGNHLMSQGLWCEAYSVYDLMRAMLPDGDPLAYDRVCQCSFLLLDDLGAVKATDWAVTTLTSIMDHRVASRRLTVITTNTTEPILRQVWGERMMDRMRKGLAVVRFEGQSRRQAAW